MKKTVLALFATLIFAGAMAQQEADTTKNWSTGGLFSVTFSQVSLTNWSAGGANSVSGNGLVNLFANYTNGKMSWDNSLDVAYGIVNQKGEGSRKSDDRIEFSSKYGQKAFGNWYYSGMISFKTQMTDGYNYPNDSVVISRLLAPGYFLVSLGMDYKPNADFSLFVSPLTGKVTVVNDVVLSDAGAFGVDPGSKVRSELGAYLKIMFKKTLMENVDFLTKLDLFSNYIDKPQNLDVSWEVLISMKINEYLSANINTHLIYDDDIKIANQSGEASPRIQFKEVVGLGFSYKF
jgi:hypothetical protein